MIINLLRNKHSTYAVNKDITVVIRGVGERTEPLCYKLIAEQINQTNIHLIHETPFSKAVKKTFEIGIKENRKWTLTVDADVLNRSNIIKDFYARAQATSKSTFVLHTEMLDKFFGGKRAGGLKLYRTKLLPKALDLIPEVANRPEGFVAKAMHKQGFYLDITDLVCGLHDFDQYYIDIFRKGFAHGIKHGTLLSVLLPYWTRMSQHDSDFAVLLAGLQVVKNHGNELKLDKNEVKNQFKAYMRASKQREKKPLSPDLDASYINSLLRNFGNPIEYKAIIAAIDKMGRPSIPKGTK